MNESIIKTENLRVIYNEGRSNEVRSLLDANLEIFPQEYLIIHGPSGCGKSTLLYSIAGLQDPTSGSVFVNGNDIAKIKEKEKVHLHQVEVGMIFQAFYLIESLSVIENVCLPQTFMSEKPKERKERGMNLLKRFGILEQADKFPTELSGGQKQRVAIARALINDPQIILADEPVGNLDSESAQNVMNIIKELNENDKKTVILVTHNAEHLFYGDRIVSMKDGRIIKEEVNKEKRKPELVKKEIADPQKEISNELSILMRTFRDLSPSQIGALLVPYKAKQLMFHVISEFSEEQFNTAEGFLREFLFKNIDTNTMREKLDKEFNQGGANWDSRRAKSFSEKVNEILSRANEIDENDLLSSARKVANYLENNFVLRLDDVRREFFCLIVKSRLENKIDRIEFQKRLDEDISFEGLGLYKNIAERVAREMEIIMLLKYSK